MGSGGLAQRRHPSRELLTSVVPLRSRLRPHVSDAGVDSCAVNHEFSDLMARIDALWGGGDLGAADHLYAEDLKVNDQPYGPDDVRATILRLRTAFPDMSFKIEQQFVVHDRVVTRLTQSGTHEGPLETPIGTIAPTGKRFTITGIEIHRIAGGKVAEAWVEFDMLGLLRQLEVRASG